MLFADWETLADRAPEELLSPQSLPGISSLSLEDSEDQHIKRRGRGPFSSKTGLYSDYLSAGPLIDVSEDDSKDHTEQQAKTDCMYTDISSWFDLSTELFYIL